MRRVPAPDQAQRFTISPSGRLIAIFPDREVNGLIIYAQDATTGPKGDIGSGQIYLRAAGNNGVPTDNARNLELTCTVNSDVNALLSCSREAAVARPSLGPTTTFVQCEPFDNGGDRVQTLGLEGDDICNQFNDNGVDNLELRALPSADTFFCDTVAFASE